MRLTFQLLWQMVLYRPWTYLINLLFWTLIYQTPLLPGLITKAFFDRLSGGAEAGLGTWEVVAALAAVALARSVFVIGGIWVDIGHRFSMGTLLRKNLLERTLEMPGAKPLPDSSGEAISHFRDDTQQAVDAISWSLDLFGNSIFAITAVVILMKIDPRIALLVFFPLAGVIAISQALAKRIEQYRRASREATTRVTGAIGEMFEAVQAVQVARAERTMIGHFRRLNDERRKLMLKDRLFNLTTGFVFSNVVSLGTGLIMLLAASSMKSGSFTVGDLALFVYYLTFVADFTMMFGNVMNTYRQAHVSMERMIAFMQGAPPERLVVHDPVYLSGRLPDVPVPTWTDADRLDRLEVSGLTYHHPDSDRGVTDISFTVERGSFTVVTGRIGSGKTTLIRVLAGLLPKESGEIRWNGNLVDHPATFFIPPRAAYTGQVPTLFTDTVKGNILMGLAEGQTDLPGAVKAAVLERDVQHLDHGLETVVGARGVKLSGGQIQRTAAARMFVREPELYLFDDLSSALDVETERTLWERVFERDGATCLVVSHRRPALRRADKIILLQGGRVIDQGRLEELLERSPEMRRLWQGDEES